jgi:hypothetical protein
LDGGIVAAKKQSLQKNSPSKKAPLVRKVAAKPKAKQGRPDANYTCVRTTAFVSAFVAELIEDTEPGTFKWPAPKDSRATIQKDFATVLDLLLEAVFKLKTPDAASGSSLRDRVATFAAAQDWPITPAIPPQWEDIRRTARFIEISLIADHLLEAINAHRAEGESGGSSSEWPPHGGG